jgi:hypothetical protein
MAALSYTFPSFVTTLCYRSRLYKNAIKLMRGRTVLWWVVRSLHAVTKLSTKLSGTWVNQR